jgi:sugar phosphate isomerase/epimerase
MTAGYAAAKKWEVCVDLATALTRLPPQGVGWLVNLGNSLYFCGRTQAVDDCVRPFLDRLPKASVDCFTGHDHARRSIESNTTIPFFVARAESAGNDLSVMSLAGTGVAAQAFDRTHSMKTELAIPRREFLKTTAGLAFTAALMGTAPRASAAPVAKRWTVAIRDSHLKVTGQPDCWAALKALDVAGVEVTVDEALRCAGLHDPTKLYEVGTVDGIKRLKDDLAAYGITITAFCMNNRLDERLNDELTWARQVVAAAQAFGANAIRIDVVPRKIAGDQFMSFAIHACKQLCDLVKDTPVRFAIENHGNWTNNPAVLRDLFDGVGSAQLGLTLDAMNFYWFGHPLEQVYGICDQVAPRAFHTHCKNLRYPEEKRSVRRPTGWEYEKYAAPVYDGDLDYQKIAASLRHAGYQGDLCLENECLGRFPKEQHLDILRKELALLKRLA